MRLALLLLVALVGGCANPVDEVLPLSRAIVGNAAIAEVEAIIHPSAAAQVAALDAAARGRDEADPLRRMPLRELLERSLRDAGPRWGLAGGRRIRVVAEVDAIGVPGTLGAAFGGEDRISGTAFIRDAETGEPLGQLYVDIRRRSPGVIGALVRGGSVRERLAREYADHVARTLSGRRQPVQ